ncbi:GNAT family N-acetyltransferase [Streptomyces odontomachi]|uniref:GNAT family N-acetyltransferase n=1 Tax=Streptomyces odontomachi TaxID=2944940 RepID=UPI00210A86EB|nr:GNAT family N-acetyltransferase [Streptomyces sp. ODS25]
MTVTFERFEGTDVVTRKLDAFLPAYEEVYVEPPYREGPRDIADFIERYRVQAERKGFRLVLASEGSEVLGFTFGFWLPPDTGWWKNTLKPLPDEFAHETGTRTFAVIELAVRKFWRRRGIAAELHSRLIQGLKAERITLTQRPEPETAPAQSAYVSWGYQKIGQSRPWDEAPLYDVMVLQLH